MLSGVKRLIAGILMVLALLLSGASILISRLPAVNISVNRNTAVSDVNVVKSASSTTIALFGVDSRNENSVSGLSDTVILANINNEDNTVKLVSVLRDSLVNIENYGQRKLCEAYSLGGAKLALKTINGNFNLDVNNYVTVNFAGLVSIIDTLGGVEIEVLEDEVKEVNGLGDEICRTMGENSHHIKGAGRQTLNGIQAVAWSRIRHIKASSGENNDFGRTSRQRELLLKIYEKIREMPKTAYFSLAKTVMQYTETSLSAADIAKYAAIYFKEPQIITDRLPADNMIKNSGKINGVWAVSYDLANGGNALKEFFKNGTPICDYAKISR